MITPDLVAPAESNTRFVVELLSVASLVALAAKRVRMPYTVALVLVGIAVGFFEFLRLREKGQVPPGIQSILAKEIEARETVAKHAQEALLLAHPGRADAQTDEIRRSLLLAERAALDLASHQGQIDARVAEHAARAVDDALLELRHDH